MNFVVVNLDKLNGATINTWVNTLRQLQDEVGKSAIISASAAADTIHDLNCTIELLWCDRCE